MPKLLVALAAVLAAAAITPIAIIALNAPKSPPAMASMAAPSRRTSFANLPEPKRFRARDGVDLQYFAYPADPNNVAVLIHGSVGPGKSMHALAQTLQGSGVTTYALDVRGHGGSGVRGDISYVGQIDDDLADFATLLGPAKNQETRTLLGFSAGAGFTIRFAGGPYGLLFDRYVFLSPILPGAPTLRPNAGGWTNISLPRIVTISYLNRAGIHWFDGFPVISYAVSPQNTDGTPSYSFRLAANFGAGRQYETYLKNIRRPAAILVGSADEQVVADQFAPLARRLELNISITIVPEMTHADMIFNPAALQMVVGAIKRP
jgi:alpha-beta hydrolase superfamily lysophospholipase